MKIAENAINTENDTIIKIVYVNEIKSNKKAAIFINELLVNETILKTINPNDIESVNVEKNDFEIENIKYYGKIKVITKNKYNPKLISLNKLKSKYVKTRMDDVIFKIDNEIITADYDKYVVDENYILKLVVENYEKEKLKISFITIITKTEDNIKKSKEIILRGSDEININNK
ncbi:hypothetical protein RF683_06400 [Flavobacterium sp. 20NA77.7]|uniref:Uncharacterized protein n=1 Tax=Flavobacterium nakdongensis TaxID=3073563 RepID=A0ABY9R8Y1_9FLAO|nr:hypothetical protein [Flavobacterium sp. 20NA77.7]WMW77124.1 hypothetical protein RF683_06400 [Flavobacterium sp. 20NA77.7]